MIARLERDRRATDQQIAERRGLLVFYDLLYRPDLTFFLKPAKKASRPVFDGRGMLLHQGALAFTLWTNTQAPLATMSRTLSQALRRSA